MEVSEVSEKRSVGRPRLGYDRIILNVEPTLAAALRRMATREQRSLTGQITVLLESIAKVRREVERAA